MLFSGNVTSVKYFKTKVFVQKSQRKFGSMICSHTNLLQKFIVKKMLKKIKF